MSLPETALPAVAPDQLHRLLRREGMFALRYPSTDQAGLPAGLYICRDKNYSLPNVARGFRSAVKTGLSRCQIRRVGPEELLTQGLLCNRDTLLRQGRRNSEFSDPKRWRRFVESAWKVSAIEVTGAFVDGQLAAYQVGCLDDGCWNIAYAFSRSALLEHRPNHALMYSTLEQILRRPEVDSVCAGPKTVLIEDGLHDFKTRMGFNLEPHQVVIRFHPALEGTLASGAMLKVMRLLRKQRPSSTQILRTEAFLSAARAARRSTQPAEFLLEQRAE
jgi:hypothetical protein